MANDSKTKTSFHLIQLKLKNFRCFSELSIDLHPDLTVFVAPNSGGKTAILDAIAIAISPFFRGVGQVPFFKNIGYKSFTILKDDIRLTPIIKDGALISMEQALGASISIRGKTSDTNKTPNKGYQWWNLEKYLLDRVSYKNHPLFLYARNEILPISMDSDYQLYEQKSGNCIPLLAYYGTGRLWDQKLWDQKKLTTGKEAKVDLTRLSGYTDAITPSSRFKHFKDWFKNIAYSLVQQKDQPDRDKNYLHLCFIKEAVVKAVDKVLEGTGWHGMDYDVQKEKDDVTIRHDQHGILTVSQMSDGFRVVIGLVADIAFRCVKLNPNLGPYACENTDGLVLIDEIDMHLHPEWQQRILASLRNAFPKIQFIVTTHSPQVLTTVKSENIRIIRDSQAIMPNMNPYAKNNMDALEGIMDVPAAPSSLELTAEFEEYKALVGRKKHSTERAIELRKKLEEEWGSEDDSLKSLDVIIRKNEILAKTTGVL